MAKAMRIPVLIFESMQEAEILGNALNLYSEEYKGERTSKVEEIRNEIQKIIIIFEKTNNN
jgi:archaellum component FlaC